MTKPAVRFNRRDIAQRLIDLAIPYIEKCGTPMICRGSLMTARPIKACIGNVEIIYLPKAARLSKTPPPHLLDIYSMLEGRKVFSAWFAPLDLVTFKPGQWVLELLGSLEAGSKPS